MFRRNKQNKAKLEHKLYLAREAPEPVFDLSECDLQEVPQGIYSLCRVFLKQMLRLDSNRLTTLAGGGNLKDLLHLRVLDLHNNEFMYLPSDIDQLDNLQELYLNNNRLKKLPDTLCNLSHLVVLNVADNFLKKLPENVGNLKALKVFNICNNKRLNCIPKSLCKAKQLTSLEVDSKAFVYPPSDVVAGGTEAILQFICNDVGIEYVGPECVDEETFSERNMMDQVDAFEAKMWKLENIKKQKLQDFLEIERVNQLINQQEFELATAQKINKCMLLADITERQCKLDSDILKLQKEKDIQRFNLIEQVVEAEVKSDQAIEQLLVLNREPLEQILANEKDEELRLVAAATKYSQALRKDDILSDMEDLLQQEMVTFRQFHENRLEVSTTILEQEIERNCYISEILQDQDFHKSELLSTIQRDADLQKAAVGTLLERSDARCWSLLQQVKMVETQLEALTVFELERKKLEIDQNLNDLSEKRINLSCLLVHLLEQQKMRRTQLLSTLQTLEEFNDNSEDFWLRQYQRLLDKLPEGLSEAQRNMDPLLAQSLLMNGVANCLPFLASLMQNKCDIEKITEDDLRGAGVINKLDRVHILDAFQMYNKQSRIYDSSASTPSAPALPVEEASAPPPEMGLDKSECVICMDNFCEVIFVSCGHFCCCSQCSTTLADCPMCRATIERKIRVIRC